jgi:hypothetical protein
MRFSIKEGLDKAVATAKTLRLYPLSKKDNPPGMEFISASGKAFNTVHANDFKFYEEVNAIIQKEPLELLDPEIRGLFASIGIEKGKPFDPDPRMKKILVDAVAIENAAARSIVWHPRVDGTMKGGEGLSWAEQCLDAGLPFQERLLQRAGRADDEYRCAGQFPLSLGRLFRLYGGSGASDRGSDEFSLFTGLCIPNCLLFPGGCFLAFQSRSLVSGKNRTRISPSAPRLHDS